MSILSIILWTLAAIGVIIGVRLNNILKKEEARKEAEWNVFLKVFRNHTFKFPDLKRGSSYGWPTFMVVFSTKDDHDEAEKQGLFDVFRERIAQLQRPGFSADIGIDFSYTGRRIQVAGLDIEI